MAHGTWHTYRRHRRHRYRHRHYRGGHVARASPRGEEHDVTVCANPVGPEAARIARVKQRAPRTMAVS